MNNLFPTNQPIMNTKLVSVSELHAAITIEEINKTNANLKKKRHKGADLENNVADFFINTVSFYSHYRLRCIP